MTISRPLCRFCGSELKTTFVDLGMSPLCESYVPENEWNQMERFYPLHVYVCENCFLVQLDEYVAPDDIFSEYAYFSSYSDSWVQHAKKYVDKVTERFGLNEKSHVVEIASNDGYLLQHFVKKGVPVTGIEPAANIAKVANEKGIPTIIRFFGVDTAKKCVEEGRKADLIVGNNVLAHVPKLNDFVAGLKILLDEEGVITMEFPHLFRLMEDNQFDTIYHEHFSYLSFVVVERVFAEHGLSIFDVEELESHGGSLRIYACNSGAKKHQESENVSKLHNREMEKGVLDIRTYLEFEERVKETKRKLLEFLIRVKRGGGHVVAYGACGKGNTLLNYCGIRGDFIDYAVDRNPYKQGKYTPGTRIPIYSPEKMAETRPDYVLILPWNLEREIVHLMGHIREWGGKFVIPIPKVTEV